MHKNGKTTVHTTDAAEIPQLHPIPARFCYAEYSSNKSHIFLSNASYSLLLSAPIDFCKSTISSKYHPYEGES